jgi:hypothetical protein
MSYEMVCQLPIDITDYIIQLSDISVKIRLYNARALDKLVVPSTFQCIENEVYTVYKQIHRERLLFCLSCLKYHVYDDGAPMKRRQRHAYKNCNHFRTPAKVR